MRRSLKGVSIDIMNLGNREYPFRISGPLDEIYTASVGRRLLMEVGKCDPIGEANKGLFERFIGKVSDFL